MAFESAVTDVLVSIVVPAHNESRYLPGLLCSLAPLYAEQTVEVIVVDNASADGTDCILQDFAVRHVRCEDRLTPSQARNLGAKSSLGRVLVFLDADIVITDEWARTLHMITQRLISEPLTVTGDTYHISTKPSWIEKWWFLPLRCRGASYINGGNLITSRRLFDMIGGFSEVLDTGEDVDFCDRARTAGATVIRDEGLRAIHEGFPKTLRGFIARERWHGAGDFLSISRLTKSKVALAAGAYALLHIALAISIAAVLFLPRFTAGNWAWLLCVSMIIVLCSFDSAHRFRQCGVRQFLVGTIVSYCYYFGRTLSLMDAITGRLAVRRRPTL